MGKKAEVWAEVDRAKVAGTISVAMCALGAKGDHPRRLFSISYDLPIHCRGKGRGFEPPSSPPHFKGVTGNVAVKTRERKRYIRENSRIQVLQQQERLPVSDAFFILGCDRLFCLLSPLLEETDRPSD